MSTDLATSAVKIATEDVELGKAGPPSAADAVADCNITEHLCTVEELCALDHINTDPERGLSKAGEWCIVFSVRIRCASHASTSYIV